MDLLTRDDLRALVSYSRGPCVSLYLPTHRSGTDALQAPIWFNNLLREAECSLRASGMSGNDTTGLLRPAHELLDHRAFWQRHCNGLAVFLAADLFRIYHVQLEVPELPVVAERFHVRPLLPTITNRSHFYVLALSQNRPRLFRGNAESLVGLDIVGMPTGMTDPLRQEPTVRQLQGRTVGSGHTGQHTAVFCGGGEGDSKALTDYFGRIDQAANTQFLKDPGPLILACMDYQYSLYRKVNSNPVLLDAWISGHPYATLPHALHQRAIAIASAHFRKVQKEAADQYLALWHTQRASNKLSDILPAALQGRVSFLLMAVGVQAWGRLDATTNEAVISSIPNDGDEDLLSMAAIHTHITGGTVYAVPPDQVPGGGEVAAVFGY
jgi:hypothetical protein